MSSAAGFAETWAARAWNVFNEGRPFGVVYPPMAVAGALLVGALGAAGLGWGLLAGLALSLVWARFSFPLRGRALLWLLLAWLTLRFATHSIASNYAGESFLHVVNLVFHEAGHVLWAVFPRFFTVLGGSLTQVLVPIVCAIAFWRRGDRFGAAVGVWWAGQNLVDLAPYINDARALELVLLGGRTGAEVEGHDWEYLLQAINRTTWDHGLARLSHAAGLLVMLGALAYAALELRRQYRDQGARAAG